MKILITGANGQLGREIIKILNNGHAEIGEIAAEIKNSKIIKTNRSDMDISDIVSTDKVIMYNEPDVIINCAAFTNVDACETNRDLAFKVNSLGPRNLAICAEKIGAKLIHISTDYVFSGHKRRPFCEYDICNPQNVYGKTKYLGEQYIRDFCSRYFIVRTSWLYGYEGNNFVKTIIKHAKDKGRVKVVNDQIGSPTNANDLAYHILKLISIDEYGIYHCTGNGECSWYDFACKIIEYSNIKCKVLACTTDEFVTIAKRPNYSLLENMMLKNRFGDEMRYWQDALKFFIENYEGGKHR